VMDRHKKINVIDIYILLVPRRRLIRERIGETTIFVVYVVCVL
jgi:hypothetical protein